VDLNLDVLKREIVEYLETSGFAVFYSSPGGLEGLPMVLWDVEHQPDYRAFLETARKAGTVLIIVAARQFESSEVDELLEQLENCDITREEQRDYERRLKDMYVFDGVTCGLELAFDLSSRFYVFEAQTDWYDEFVNIEDEIVSRLSEDEEEAGHDDSLGGFFSKN
jgi:hypothetical protein